MPDPTGPMRLGKYRLIRRLAVGGMAEIYLAVAEGLSGFEKRVVVKRLLPQHTREQDLLTMFVDEARLLARMRHANIAEVYDIGQDGDEIFFALEHVDGVDLRELLRAAGGAPLPLAETLWILVSVAEGLGYAHELCDEKGASLGIVHRDVSPSNVLVADTGEVKLVDFGVAKWHAQRSETRHGTLKGKVNYMSPEQCRSEALDARSDVFALGVLLYELSTGKRPFAAPNDFDVLGAIAAGSYEKPSRVHSDYDPRLEAIVVRALQGDRAQRLPSARGFAEALRGFATAAGLALSREPVRARVAHVRVTRVAEARAAGSELGAAVAVAAADIREGRGEVAALERTLTAADAGALRNPGGAPGALADPARDATRSASFARRARRRLGLGIALGAGAAILVATAFVAATAGHRDGVGVTDGKPAQGAERGSAPTASGGRPAVPGTAGATARAEGNAQSASPPSFMEQGGGSLALAPPRTPPRSGEQGSPPLANSASATKSSPAAPDAGVAARAPSPPVPPQPTKPSGARPGKVWDPDSPIPP